MAKKRKTQTKPIVKRSEALEIDWILFKKYKVIFFIVLILISIILPVYFISYTASVNSHYGFPLDDPWIHLTFAKNLVEYGSFSYFKNEIVTAGSTSPVYTALLAAGYIIYRNEMILSYILGIIFFTLSVYFYYRLCGTIFIKENWPVLAAVVLFVLDKWIIFISVSGMETTLFIFFLIANFYYYRKRDPVLFALTLGLIFWTRPDGIAYIGAVFVDYLIFIYYKSKSPKINDDISSFTNRDYFKIGLVFGIIMLAYFGMNLALSGSLLPNTYNAKLTYYSPEFRSRSDFLKVEVWDYFIDSSYLIFIIPFFISLLNIGRDTFKKRYNAFVLPALFIFALIFIYWYKLPYAHRFGRYLMPVLPFYILMFVNGTRILSIYIYKFIKDRKIANGFAVIIYLIAVIYAVSDIFKWKDIYAEQNEHIHIRQVVTAKWLHDNTPENSIIATHDVGAIGFYSERKVIDVAGLINPELITKLLDPDYNRAMMEAMNSYGVTHTAFLREWYRVVNSKPIFITGTNNLEIMEVHKYDPGRTYVMNGRANSGVQYALQLLSNKQFPQALNVFQQASNIDPGSSLIYFYIGYVYDRMNDHVNAEKNYKKALEIFPGFSEAAVSLADIYKKKNDISSSRKVIGNILQVNPTDSLALSYFNLIKDTTKTP